MAKSKVKSEALPKDAFPVGGKFLIRTVTNYWTGEVVAVRDGFLILSTAAWIADTGRFSDAAKHGRLNEVEPVGGLVRVAIGSIVDAVEWTHALPTDQK